MAARRRSARLALLRAAAVRTRRASRRGSSSRRHAWSCPWASLRAAAGLARPGPSRATSPLPQHLVQAVHEDGGPLAILFGRQRLQQLDSVREVGIHGLLGRPEVEPANLREGGRRVGRPRRREERATNPSGSLATIVRRLRDAGAPTADRRGTGCSARRAPRPMPCGPCARSQSTFFNSATLCASELMASRTPYSRATRACISLKSSRCGWLLISMTTRGARRPRSPARCRGGPGRASTAARPVGVAQHVHVRVLQRAQHAIGHAGLRPG